jgi:hypothetical protein
MTTLHYLSSQIFGSLVFQMWMSVVLVQPTLSVVVMESAKIQSAPTSVFVIVALVETGKHVQVSQVKGN